MEITYIFITYINDFSKNTLTYFLKEKAYAYENFKIFKVYVKKQNQYIIKF